MTIFSLFLSLSPNISRKTTMTHKKKMIILNNNLWHTEHKLGDRRPLKIFAGNLGCRADSSEHGSRFSESLPRNAEQFQPGSTIHLWRTTLQPNIYRGRAFDSRRHLRDDFILFFLFFFFFRFLLFIISPSSLSLSLGVRGGRIRWT